MSMKYIILGASLMLLSACADSDLWKRNMEFYGAIAIEPSKEYGAHYRAKFTDVIDLGYNGDNRDDRIKLLNSYSENQCPVGYTIMHEETIKTGKWMSGDTSENYFIYIKCNMAR